MSRVVRSKPSKPLLNSISALAKVHKSEQESNQAEARRGQIERFKSAMQLTANLGSSELIRSEFLRFLLDGPRDIDSECGYPAWLTPDHYRVMYDREGISKRVVECEAKGTWVMDPEVYEDDDPDTTTPFEAAWEQLVTDYNIFHYLQRIDILSGIGQYGILLLGINDGKNLHESIDGINPDGTFDEGNEYKILYMRPFSEEVVFVKLRETNTSNPRYGLPLMYTIHFRDFPNWGVQAGEIVARDVHWSRVIHVADNRKMSEIYGIPRMQPVYNRLYDLRKVYAASGEAYWKGAFPGFAFEVNPELADQGIELDTKSIREEMEKYSNGLQRYMAVTGVTTKSLPPTVTDPSTTVETHLKAIAIALEIPFRILFGSEEAQLASAEDTKAWVKKLASRQTKYVNPLLIRPFIDKMVALGVLPKPKKVKIDWPDQNTPSDKDSADISFLKAQAMAQYVTSGASALMPPKTFLMEIMGFNEALADSALKDAAGFNDDSDVDEAEGKDEGSLGIEQPDQGNALDQKSLSGADTQGGSPRVDSQLVYMPGLNSSGKKGGKKAKRAKK